ncbi:hypothetical protein [Actinomadura formosensis]|uniref:hypothetical protein n=1 Tax=Actinomadura formosensis TaxID=60706 RepID=UPI00082C1211|nr:hypothetical protein [Actinomadura formosensis]
MGYPGNQGKPGDWPSRQSPQAPYGPGAEAPPYGHDKDEAPFAPRDGGDEPTPWADQPTAWDNQPTAWDDQHAAQNDQPTAQTDRPAAWSDQPVMQSGQPTAWADEPVAGSAVGDGSFGSYEGAPPGPSGESSRPEKRRNLPLIIGGSAVAGILLIGGGVGLSSMLKGDPKPKATPTQTPSTQAQPTPSPTQPVLAPVKLQSRTTDPKPLTLKEVFGKASFKAGGYKYVRTAVNAQKSCTGVVGGTALEKALKKGGCTQALRATYALSSGSLIGTVGVFNLKDETAAKKAVKAAAAKEAFLQALPGKGVSKTNGKGEAFGTSQARGHYVIMTWVQRPDGKKIVSKYHAAVQVFGTQMVKGSNLALALHYRETEGKPLQK